MKVKKIKAKSIITKSGLPGTDYVINPYVGCQHGCKYCYARFMKRFTGHKEPWGSFLDVKINAPDLVKGNYRNKDIVMSSVTDPYLPLEKEYKLTRRILEKLIPLQPRLNIITKSDLVLRDIDLLKQFKDCVVSVSLSILDEKSKELEPVASSPERRIKALKELHRNGIYTVLFVSPIILTITDWKKIIEKTRDFVDEYWFENLNLYPAVKGNLSGFFKKNKITGEGDWDKVEGEIREYCKGKVKYKMYFHHKRTR